MSAALRRTPFARELREALADPDVRQMLVELLREAQAPADESGAVSDLARRDFARALRRAPAASSGGRPPRKLKTSTDVAALPSRAASAGRRAPARVPRARGRPPSRG